MQQSHYDYEAVSGVGQVGVRRIVVIRIILG